MNNEEYEEYRTPTSCDRDSLMKQIKCLREEKEDVEYRLEKMTYAYNTATKMVAELQEYMR